MDAILGDECDELIIDLPKKTLPGFCRNAVLITENELHALVGDCFRLELSLAVSNPSVGALVRTLLIIKEQGLLQNSAKI